MYLTTNTAYLRLQYSIMKTLFTLLSLFLFVSLNAQDSTVCNQLPYAKVDKKAKVTGELKDWIKDQMPRDLKENGEHQAIFKLIVDCNGKVVKQKYADGNLSTAHQKWLGNLIDKSTWKAAQVKDKQVSSTVFITVTIKKGQVDLEIQ